MKRTRLAIPGALTAGLFLASAFLPAPPTPPARCPFRPELPSAPRRSPPVPDLEVDSQGAVTGLRVDGRAVPTVSTPGGFSLRLVGGMPDLVANGSFENDGDGDGLPDGWALRGASFLAAGTAHVGARSIGVRNSEVRTSVAFEREVSVRPSTYYFLTAWTRSERVEPTIATAVREPAFPHSPVRVEVQPLSDGGRAEGDPARAYGYTNTADWNRQSVGFRTGPNVHRVRVRGLLAEGTGTAWFDDITISELFQPREIAVRGSVAGSGPASAVHAAPQGLGLAVDATVVRAEGVVRVDGVVEGTTREDRGFQVAFTLPLNARGWRWGEYARRSVAISSGRYAYETTSSLQTSSRYPLAGVWGDGFGIGMAVPLSEPRLFRFDYTAGRGLTVTFDLAVSPAATALGPRATFSFVLFAYEPSWGFRAAIERYYQIFPESFVRRTDPACEGGWFFAPPLYALPVRQLGLGLNTVALGKAPSQRQETWGTRFLAFDRAEGIYASAYGHHWAYYLPFPGRTPSYEGALAALRAAADGSSGTDADRRRQQEAMATLRSAPRDLNGRIYYERFGPYLAFYETLDPSVPGPSWTEAVLDQQVRRALRLARAAASTLDGVHLDSTSGMRRWGAAEDHDRAHWGAASIPLTFSYDGGEVAQRGIFPMYGHLVRVAAFVHARKMILSANFNGDEARTLWFVGADRIDYFGLEQGLADRVTPEVSLDQFAMAKRTLAYHRPISTLDRRAGEGDLSTAELDDRLQQNLFYGMYGGAFDASMEADGRAALATWTSGPAPQIWARYTPIVKELAAAGWEPVTYARSSNPAVWVERFGDAIGGALLFTLRNETQREQGFSLAIDRAGLGIATPRLAGTELVTGTAIAIGAQPGELAFFSSTLPPRSTRVVLVRVAP